MSKHTSGPWKAGKATIRGMVAEISATRGEATYTIAHVDQVDGGDKDAANAHLIAAAPDLLAAALPAERLEHLAKIPDDDRVSLSLTGSELRALLAAIAKARGQS